MSNRPAKPRPPKSNNQIPLKKKKKKQQPNLGNDLRKVFEEKRK